MDGAKLPDDDDLPEELRELRFRNGIEVTRQSFDSEVKRLLLGLSLNPQAAHQKPTATGGSDADDALVVTTSDAGFENDVVLKSNSMPVIAFFGAPWCGVCVFIRPQLEQAVRQENGGSDCRYLMLMRTQLFLSNSTFAESQRCMPTIKATRWPVL